MLETALSGMHPLLAAAPLHAPLAWRAGQPISRQQYLADVQRLAQALPEGGPLLALTSDRYRFTLALGAALLRGQCSLLPPNHTPDMVARLCGLFPQAYALVEALGPVVDLPQCSFAGEGGAAGASASLPEFDAATVVAQVLTSGSTGTPSSHAKHWGGLVENIGAEAQRMAEHMGREDLTGVAICGTVPPHHMYGFESTVLIAMLGGASFAAERPFFPADVVQVLQQLPRPRVLVTTPFHLKTVLDAQLDLPAVDLVVCATAPLSPQMAARAEAAFAAPLMEIYGCTEAGQIATRRTTAGAEWQTYRGLMLGGDGEHAVVSGGHVPQPTPLADVLEVLSPTRFRLLGRSNDLINIAGKRSSLSHLNYHLNSIEGVRDGAFWMPPAESVEGVTRLVAFVVAPGVSRERILAELRRRIDPVLLPRRIVPVDALPRDPTGKLPAARLNQFGARWLQRDATVGTA